MRGALARVAVAVTTMVALAFLIPLAMLVRQQAVQASVADAQRRAAAIGPVLAVTSDPELIGAALRAGDRGPVGVQLPDGTVVGDVRASPAQLRQARETSAGAVDVPGGSVVLQPVVLGDQGVAVVEASVLGRSQAALLRAWAILAAVAVALVTTSVLVADRLAARLVRAVDGLAASARSIGDGDLGARVDPGPYELGEVGDAFNTMAERLRVLVESERQFAADVSHRLRTPLTALRLEAARLPGTPAGDQVRQAVAAMEHEVDDVIRSARSGRREPEQSWCDAAEQVAARTAFWTALGAGQGRRVDADLARPPAQVPLPAADVAAVVDALVGNVFRHTPAGTALRVTLTASSGRVSLVVEDAGPGIPDAARDPRRRAPRPPGSTGLGLDIVRRNVERVGGRVEVGRSPLGGALVRLSLPDRQAWDGHATARRRRGPRARRPWRRADERVT